MSSLEFKLWKLLDKPPYIAFGKECLNSTIWTYLVLLLKALISFLQIEAYIPRGFLFALPFFVQLLHKYLPFFETYPILSVRLAESLLGKIAPVNLLIIIPAQLLGGVMGIIWFKTSLPFISNTVLNPLQFENVWIAGNLFAEILLNFIYASIILVLPHILEINRFKKELLSIPIIPLFLLKFPSETSTFNPTIIYALWFVNSYTGSKVALPTERLIGPIIGAILAGLFCNKYFPDDLSSWSRKKGI